MSARTGPGQQDQLACAASALSRARSGRTSGDGRRRSGYGETWASSSRFSRGTLSEEGIQAFVDASLEADEDLPQDQRDLLRQMTAEQLAAALPLDLAAQSDTQPGRLDWVAGLAAVPGRCTVAISTDQRIHSWVDFEASLRRRAPDVVIVRLTTHGSSVLWQPEELSGLVQDLLQG